MEEIESDTFETKNIELESDFDFIEEHLSIKNIPMKVKLQIFYIE